MSLAMLALQTMLLILEVAVGLVPLSMPLSLKLGVLLVLLELLLVHLLELVDRHLEIRHKCIAPAAAKVFAHNHSHHLQLLRVWCHGVRWYLEQSKQGQYVSRTIWGLCKASRYALSSFASLN